MPSSVSDSVAKGPEMTEVSSANGAGGEAGYYQRDAAGAGAGGAAQAARSKRRRWLLLGGLALVVVLAVAIPVGVVKSRKSDSSSASSSSSAANGDGASSDSGSSHHATATSSGASAAPSASSTVATFGINGSRVRLDNGSDVTYVNPFGGTWRYDPANPAGPGGQAQEWSRQVSPNETIDWASDHMYGVNLGGWLVLEPFIVPAIFEKWHAVDPNIVDEWTLSVAMGAQLQAEMEAHYSTFITEMDFMEIAAAGLNWVRIPIGFWAIETMPGEPFLAKTSWTYFLKAIGWARKYGIKILLDVHSLPGSQNGWNHSGKVGSINFLAGTMGLANAERALSVLQTFNEFISQPEYKDVVPILSLVNEILFGDITIDTARSFYLKAITDIRASTGSGAGNGPFIAVHDGFQSPSGWTAWLPGADRVILDNHSYLAFNAGLHGRTLASLVNEPCGWGAGVNDSLRQTGVTIGGEFSAASNDCGYWLNGIQPDGSSTNSFGDATCGQTGTAGSWDNYRTWDAARIANVKQLAMNSMDSLQNFFFWTWKIQESTVLGYAGCPDWHYRLGLELGWIPKDPREVRGICAASGTASTPFTGNFPFPEATGGVGTGISAASRAAIPWPPAAIRNIGSIPMASLPRYTATGTPVRLPVATAVSPSTTVSVGSGWANPLDTQLPFVPVAGCVYPNAWAGGTTLPASYVPATCRAGQAGAAAPAAPAPSAAAPSASATTEED